MCWRRRPTKLTPAPFCTVQVKRNWWVLDIWYFTAIPLLTALIPFLAAGQICCALGRCQALRKKVLSSPVPLHEAPNLQPQEALSYQWQLGYAVNVQRSSLSSLPHPQHRKIERQVSFLVCKPKKHMPESLSIRKEKLYTICQGICHHFLEKKENNLLICECFLC